jgi:V/A-type H+-transporting ATPase subunit D
MAKIRLTKGELKRQRDALRQYQRYLPTLQLKKQQLQIEILRALSVLEEKRRNETAKRNAMESWLGLLSEQPADMRSWVKPKQIIAGSKNIAGVDLAVFERGEFPSAEYDLFVLPLWVDNALEALRELVSLREEINIINRGIETLRQELRITTQRVNLFEKVKIPETEEAIRLIKIYIGDQMTNAVGRSKIAKNKIEQSILEEVAA